MHLCGLEHRSHGHYHLESSEPAHPILRGTVAPVAFDGAGEHFLLVADTFGTQAAAGPDAILYRSAGKARHPDR